MRDLKSAVCETIKKYRMIKPQDLIITGVSGGPDSLTLLHLLLELREDLGFALHVAHLDHSFRGREAEEEARWVKETAARWGLPCTLAKVDVPALAKKKGLSPQEAGHEARTDFFLRLKEQLKANRIAVGHQADDQAETILLHLLTGAGSEGLCGILPVKGPFIRPLLFIQRQEIEEYCERNNLNPRRDPSNAKDIYLRNLIRNQLVPWLKDNINPNLIETLGRTARIFADQEEFLQEVTEQAAQAFIKPEQGNVRITRAGFAAQTPAIQRRLIRRAYRLVGKKQGLSFDHVEKVRELLLTKQVGKTLHLPQGVIARNEYLALLLTQGKTSQNKGKIERKRLTVPGKTYIPETGQVVEAGVAEKLPATLGKMEVYLPWEEYTSPLYVRSRQEGDRFAPSGLKGSKKLKDYFIDKKIPQRIRDHILLIADESEVLWIPGYAAGRRLNKTSQCGRYVVLSIRHEG